MRHHLHKWEFLVYRYNTRTHKSQPYESCYKCGTERVSTSRKYKIKV